VQRKVYEATLEWPATEIRTGGRTNRLNTPAQTQSRKPLGTQQKIRHRYKTKKS